MILKWINCNIQMDRKAHRAYEVFSTTQNVILLVYCFISTLLYTFYIFMASYIWYTFRPQSVHVAEQS